MSLVLPQSARYALGCTSNAPRDGTQAPVRTKGEIEAAICELITHFEQEYLGRGPRFIRAYLIGELLVVRLQGVLTAAELQLVKAHPPEQGRQLLKQVRTQLIETARPVFEPTVHWVTGAQMLSLHHDISTVTGEEVILFTLAKAPHCKPPKKRGSQDSD